jgi:hypothetical protein
MALRFRQLLLALSAVATSSHIAATPTVLIPQISSQIAAKTAPELPGSTVGSNDLPKQSVQGPTADEIELCRSAQLGGAPPEGVDCQTVLQFAPPELRPTAESTLLMLLGEPGSVTRPGLAMEASGSNADIVARQISTGSFDGNAAGIAARERGAPAQTPSGR